MAAKGNKSIWKSDWRQTSVDDCKFKLLGLNNFVRGFDGLINRGTFIQGVISIIKEVF